MAAPAPSPSASRPPLPISWERRNANHGCRALRRLGFLAPTTWLRHALISKPLVLAIACMAACSAGRPPLRLGFAEPPAGASHGSRPSFGPPIDGVEERRQ